MDESNPGGGSDMIGLRGAAVAQTGAEIMAAHLSSRMRPDITTAASDAHQTVYISMHGVHATHNKGHVQEGQEEEELRGMLSFPSAQENNNALGTAQAGNSAPPAAIGAGDGMDMDSCTGRTVNPIQPEATVVAPDNASDKPDTADAPKKERSFLFTDIAEQVR